MRIRLRTHPGPSFNTRSFLFLPSFPPTTICMHVTDVQGRDRYASTGSRCCKPSKRGRRRRCTDVSGAEFFHFTCTMILSGVVALGQGAPLSFPIVSYADASV